MINLSFLVVIQVQENHVLNSESCIRFLLKLLNPPMDANDVKAPSIGSKLLGISKVQMFNGSNKDSDSSSEDIISKVEEILLSCKEIKPLDRDGKRASRPELCSKWLALLTMEKACLSAVALEGMVFNQFLDHDYPIAIIAFTAKYTVNSQVKHCMLALHGCLCLALVSLVFEFSVMACLAQNYAW